MSSQPEVENRPGRRFGMSTAVLLSVIAIVVLGACILLYYGLKASPEETAFQQLRLNRRDAETARPIAEELAEKPKGVALALEDFNVFGGRTRGWSSLILERSSLASLVEPRLKSLVDNPNAPLSGRLEAVHIMWRRTGDVLWLERLFIMVKEPGPQSILNARAKLAGAFAFSLADFRMSICVPHSRPIDMELDAFRTIISKPENLIFPPQLGKKPGNG